MTEWRCFHCDQVFTDYYAAENHFGKRTTEPPECYPYLGLVRELRAENQPLRTALQRIVSLGEKNVPKYAQEIARVALETTALTSPKAQGDTPPLTGG